MSSTTPGSRAQYADLYGPGAGGQTPVVAQAEEPTIFVIDRVQAFVAPVATRLPFRYGIAEMTNAPHVLVRVDLHDGATTVTGHASEHLPPKWFVKDAALPFQDEVVQLSEAILAAAAHAHGLRAETPFDLALDLDERQRDWARRLGVSGLVAGLGTALIERAIIDAACRGLGRPFWDALESGALGLDAARVHPELVGRPPRPVRRAAHIGIRHTVGLGDPLTDAEIVDDPDDTLPVSVQGAVRRHGLQWLKLKTVGDIEADVERIRRVEEICAAEGVRPAFTIDGNESMRSGDDLVTWLQGLRNAPALEGVLDRLVAVEQPLHRSVALSREVTPALERAVRIAPVIIDESDEDLHAVRRAMDLGYSGGTYKGCKGVFRGLANAALIAARGERRRTVLTAEDLCTIPPLTVGQDLVVCAAMGLSHVERNGHHYFGRLAPLGADVDEQAVLAHPDVYAVEAGRVRLQIRDGGVSLRTLGAAPFGYGGTIDDTGMDTLTPARAAALA
ncbi:hypothetical protein [Pseudactinotalea suaedae]|uniref:hypothetical protein n=1 Tax=Pseudactinotalea suaedae TaxID=1524924 RepID=UPI0012E2F01C|nr:hypothetical protein [Pseudactinotalea suaedae]